MTVSLAELGRLVAGLEVALAGGVVQGAKQPAAELILLDVRSPGQSHTLLVCVAPRRARIHRTARRFQSPQSPFGFVMKLRKDVVGARVVAVRQAAGERVVSIDLERGPRHPQGEARLSLLVELSAHHPNAFLLDEAGVILTTMVTSRSAKRDLRAGQPYAAPLPHSGAFREADRLLDEPDPDAAMDRIYEELEAEAERFDQINVWRKGLKTRVDRERRKVDKITLDLARAEDAGDTLRKAELLKTALHEIPPGATMARVTDWWDPELATVEVLLDPAVPARVQVDRMFHQARRRKEAAGRVRERLAQVRADLQRLEAAEGAFEAAEASGAPEDLQAALTRLRGLGVGPRPPKQRKERPEARLPYTAHVACDGSRILVGRNARDNDTLTFQVARGDDWWLHARGRRGAHVILRVARGAQPSEEALAEAAQLAAWGSEGGARDTLVEIAATPRRLVRKPPGAAPGAVTFSKARTILVTPDAERIALIRSRLAPP